jgi:RNA polymerase sigma factor (sigma-70 family)
MSTADARPTARDEAQMVAAILAGDRDLYHRLIEPYELSVYRMALSFMKDETEAEDVAQEGFLKAFRNLASFQGESNFSTWLISIALNEARKRLRRQNTVWMESLEELPKRREAKFRRRSWETGGRFPPKCWSDARCERSFRRRTKNFRRSTGRRWCCATSKSSALRRRPECWPSVSLQ